MTWNPSVQPGAHKHADRNDDFYQTPDVATRALLGTGELTNRLIWEPACGAGAISEVLKEHDYDVISTDRYERGYGTTGEEWNFIAPGAERPWANLATIVTNPPFMHADAFILKALEHSPKAVMLLRWAYAQGEHGGSRRDGARSRIMDQHCSRAYLFIDRLPMMHREGYTGKKHKSSAMAHAWFVFERKKDHDGFFTKRISWKAAQSRQREELCCRAQLHAGTGSQSQHL